MVRHPVRAPTSRPGTTCSRRPPVGPAGQLVFGRGERRLAFVAVDDVVALAARAATDPALLGEVLEIGGEPIAMEQLALAVQAAHGWREARDTCPERPCESPPVVARPFSPTFARQNRLALVMDTTDLGVGDPELRGRLGFRPRARWATCLL